MVLFSRVQNEPIVYNLAFGDEDPKTGLVNDLVVSNNQDREIVLATVASMIHTFCDHYGNHYIYAKESTTVSGECKL